MSIPEAAITACRAVIEQNKRSFSAASSTCMYRGPNGLKCAVGHLIADEHYSVELEGKGVNTRMVSDALVASGIPEADLTNHIVLWSDIQNAHDHANTDKFKATFAAYIEKKQPALYAELIAREVITHDAA